ncbi:MAG: hypothetical protein CGU28_13780 [Candidatus Dactylopiibacterium carminicum]|uniref:Virulence sensor protein BvgS n=1 Tax=Candidatus Dactylopiibacterium carminicum TaxID=857335 RepID=A0A272EP10_9RHOO|nr:MAG: hypothetical protein CGU29_14320 [Candidatus Dactylopiibacterium carminicum]PAS94523.1 MAG: hypothetical protein CGU28_13780 [Candidatus Dactylopiibacterium carminicum]
MRKRWRGFLLYALFLSVTASCLYFLSLPSWLDLLLLALLAWIAHILSDLRNTETGWREFTQRFIDAIPEPIYIKDAQARFLMVNEAFAQERRVSASALIGQTSFDLARDEQTSELVAQEDAAVLDGNVVSKEQHTTYPITGEECYRLVSKRLCNGPRGEPLIIGAHFDITGLRHTEIRMQEALIRETLQRERMQTYMQRVIDVIPQPVYIKAADSSYLMINQAFSKERMLGADSLLGRTPYDLAKDSSFAERVIAEDQEVLSGRMVLKEERLPHPVTGAERFRIISKGSCLDPQGNPVIVGANFDITNWREAEQRWQQASAAKSHFLASMSHEIRTPLSGVIGTLQLALSTRGISPDVQNYLANGLQSAENLMVILNDILDFSAIEAGKLKLEELAFNLPECLEAALTPWRIQAKQKGLEFLVDTDQSLAKHVRGDPGRLKQILVNLLSNAIKFTERGELRIAFRTRPAKQTNRLLLEASVADTGIGIPTQAMPGLFRMFQQADTSSTRRFSGTGLGLAITRQLVEAMNGSIQAQSESGQGSLFSFQLELGLAEADEIVEEHGLRPHARPLHVLYAEDVRVNQLIVSAQLHQMGHTVEIAGNGREALEALARTDFDLVLMDGRMPEMDGHEATRLIREGGLPGLPVRKPQIHIVAITANAALEDQEACLAAGMNEVLIKPVREAQLHALLQRFIDCHPG